MKSKKGITLIALTTMMLLIIFLTSTLTYISVNSLELKQANDVKADLRTLYDKVESFYLASDSLPTKGNKLVIVSSANPTKGQISNLELPEAKRNRYDGDNYYLIDYDLLDGLKLNYSDRSYVINEVTHTIYALDGFYGTDDKEYTLPYVNHINSIIDE